MSSIEGLLRGPRLLLGSISVYIGVNCKADCFQGHKIEGINTFHVAWHGQAGQVSYNIGICHVFAELINKAANTTSMQIHSI